MTVLDVGAGRRPTVAPGERPQHCHYVGIDLSAAELDAAPPDAYDEIHVGDAADRDEALVGRFDLVISCFVLEHVRPLSAALDNFHSYLRPQGHLLSVFSGTLSIFSIANLLVPNRVAAAAMRQLHGRDPGTVFRARYDRCWYSALAKLLRVWSEFEIVPCYWGANYVHFSRVLEQAYLRYEDWAADGEHRNLATHYLIDATR